MEPSSKELSDSIKSKLSNLCPLSSDCCIYRVPEDLLSINREAYKPLMVSIGPFHYTDKRLCAMQEYKLRYLESFLTRANSHNLEDYISFVKRWEKSVRECYTEEFTLSSASFVEMVLVDGAFIIELFLRWHSPQLREANDRIFGHPYMMDRVCCDMRLEENQLPFSFIQGLYDFAFTPDDYRARPSFLELNFEFFNIEPGEMCPYPKHFVDVLRACYSPLFPRPRPLNPSIPPFYFSVTHLLEAGGKIVLARGSSSLLDITFQKGVLSIPKIVLVDYTELDWRNLVVFEQCHCIEDSYITNYLVLLDHLIDDPKDVKILIEKDILRNRLGNNKDALDPFGNLVKQINIYDKRFYYSSVCRDLNAYYNSTWHKSKAVLRQKYFSHP